MGFNRRKREDRRRQEAEREATARRATDPQILEDADYLIAEWNASGSLETFTSRTISGPTRTL
jgi:hypothetical protein